jgi:hypothetical protein
MRIAIGAALIAAQLAARALAAPPKSAPTPTAIPLHACSAAETGEWTFVREQQLGIQARARTGAGWVGMTAATDGFHDWAPFDDFKTTICGQLMVFGTFEPTRENPLLHFLPEIPEHDWNVILIPTRESIFDERFKLATKLMDRGHEGDLDVCFDRRNPCFEAEVTPNATLLKANADDQWLSACRLGQTVCVFGPWVGDGGHGHRPEIHPAERIWWRDDAGRVRLVFVQDASQRFGDRRHFQWTFGQTEPGSWHPWAAPQLEGEFRMAFEASKGSTVRFEIEQLLDGNTLNVKGRIPGTDLTFPLEQDGSAGTVRAILRTGSKSDRLELDLSKLDVSLVDVCDRGDGTLQGYLVLGDKLGHRYQEGEGFDIFAVTPPPFLRADEPSNSGPTQQPVGEVREHLHASVRVSASEEQTASAPTPSVAGVLSDLLDAATDKPLPVEAPVTQRAEQAQAVARIRTQRPALEVGFARRFRLSARPHYDGPRGERMESAIDGAKHDVLQRLLEAVPTPVPERVFWRLAVSDFTDPERLPGPPVMTCTRRLLVDDECVLELPGRGDGGPPGQVLRVIATARILDADGNPIPEVTTVGRGAPALDEHTVAQQQIRLGSHFIRATNGDSAEKVLAWLSAASGASAADLIRLSRSQDEARPNAHGLDLYRREYYARMLRHGIRLATRDGRITLDELAQFVDMTQAFEKPPPLTNLPPPPTAK